MTKAVTTSDPQTRAQPPAPSLSNGTCQEMEEALARMPFRAELSFEPLFRQLKELTGAHSNERCQQGRALVAGLEGIEELRGAIQDPSAVERHQDAIRMLMSFVFPELTADETPVRAYQPFSPVTVFTTSSYHEVFDSEEVEVTWDMDTSKIDHFREHLYFAYSMLYHIHYQVERSKRVVVKRVRNTRTGLDRFFLVDYRFRFVEATYPGLEMPPEREFARLLDMEDVDELQRRVPMDNVVFSGFNTIQYIEITELHNLSLLKSELVEEGALNSPERLTRIVDRLRSVLQVPDLDAGIVLRYAQSGDHNHCTARSIIKDFTGCLAGIEETIYGEAIRSGEPLFVPDLNECDCEAPITNHLRAQGTRSIGLIPLLDDDEVIGFLELASKQSEEINASAGKKLIDLLAPLTIAARREIDETVSRIERTIKAHCTAIHPSVEWRFSEAAYKYNVDMAEQGQATFEDIEFENVHPLYGSMDIRGSSDSRTKAIQADLVEHLDLARGVMAKIHQRHAMPIADYYDSVLARFRESVLQGLSSGDELSVIEFLKLRVEPFFDYVKEHMPLAEDDDAICPIGDYYGRLDPGIGILYRERKEYEESVSLINDALAAFLDGEDEKAQAIFPHYFEKYKTDGVEHNIYVGQSMTRERQFDDVQLKNLRLWQLQLMCEKARLAETLVPQMKVKLRTTPLILVQSSPLTIQFSTEAKQFQVEGSYNIRYEIIKKRIDKSTIRGTGERLTQPGYLSVIYSQDKEGQEYLRYCEYLAERGVLGTEIENLELEDMPGVHGLRALRAPIVLD